MGRRLGYVDVIKGLVVAGVVAAHAAMTYGLFGNWPYQETAHPFPVTIGYAVAVLTMLGMGMLFLLAGLFTPAAIASKGLRHFVNERWVRLGIPTVVYLLAVMPAVNFLGQVASGSSAAAALGYARDHALRFDLGPMWFVFALLLVTLGYAGWRRISRPRAPGVGPRDLVLLAAICAAATFLVRGVQPVDDPAPVNVAGWPPDFILFVLGALAGATWLERVPPTAERAASAMIAAGLALLLPLAVLPPPSFSWLLGGWHWQSGLVSAAESLVTIGLSIWLLRQFQRVPRDPLPSVTHGSFAAYLIQTPVILLLGIAMRPLVLAPELKAVILAGLGLAACFSLAAAYRRRPRRRQRVWAKPELVLDGRSSGWR